MPDLIGLRSVTDIRPSPEMRAAIAAAPLRDDQFGENLTGNLVRERIATAAGKESAFWLPSGTMATIRLPVGCARDRETM